MKTLPITELGKDILNYYKSIDCKYFVINTEDLVSCLNEEELNFFLDILDKFNAYRDSKGKSIHKYFVLNRDSFPDFKDNALAFVDWAHKMYHMGD